MMRKSLLKEKKKKKKIGPPCRCGCEVGFTRAGSSLVHGLVGRVKTKMLCRFYATSVLAPHEEAAVVLRRFSTTSSYSFCVNNPSVMLLLSSNLGNTTAM